MNHMATIRKRGNNYQIRVSCGYKTTGEQIIKTTTYKPPKGITPKQLKKELERQAVLFEEKCLNGTYLDGNIKLADFAEKWFKDYAEKHLRSETYYTYKLMIKRVNEALGHIRIDRIQPHHLLEFYNNLAESGIRDDIKYNAAKDVKALLKSKGMTQKALCEKANISEATLRSCIKGNNITKAAASKIMTALDDDTIFKAVNTDKTLSQETILHHHRFISTMLSCAVEWQLIPSNPCARVKPPKVDRKEAQYLDEKQAAKLINCLDAEPLKYKTIIMLLLYSGMRRGELCGLEWSDIDLNHGIISISKSSLYLPQKGIFDDTTKNRTSERVIRVPEAMTSLLKEYRRSQSQLQLAMGDLWQGSEKVFTSQTGTPIHPDSITGWFKSFIKRNDLPDIHLHSLRHTNATLLIAAGTDIRTVANRLGHATASTTTNIYAHAIKSADELAAEKLADILNPIKRNAK